MAQFLRVFGTLLTFVVSFSAALLGEDSGHRSIEFFVVIPSYNNAAWCEKNLESVFCQTNQSWTIFYIDDCSTDGTGKLVDNYVKARGMEQKCTIVHNTERRGAMANLYFTISQAAPEKIVVDIDGDDWLADDNVFQTLADVYKDPEVWLTYGSYQYEPGGTRGVCKPLPEDVLKNASIRSRPQWETSQLRTFYAALFHKVKKEDFMMKGKFFEITSDVALFMPMIEMASHGHIRYIDRILYIYNYTNPISDSTRRKLQLATDLYIRSLRPYKPIDRLFPVTTAQTSSPQTE
jgi:glycosyltransferase involved in cell wall biosynthesis